MKLPLSALCILVVLAACTARPGISGTGTPSVDLPTLPAISTPRPAPTETPVPPSPNPVPSATPLPTLAPLPAVIDP